MFWLLWSQEDTVYDRTTVWDCWSNCIWNPCREFYNNCQTLAYCKKCNFKLWRSSKQKAAFWFFVVNTLCFDLKFYRDWNRWLVIFVAVLGLNKVLSVWKYCIITLRFDDHEISVDYRNLTDSKSTHVVSPIIDQTILLELVKTQPVMKTENFAISGLANKDVLKGGRVFNSTFTLLVRSTVHVEPNIV